MPVHPAKVAVTAPAVVVDLAVKAEETATKVVVLKVVVDRVAKVVVMAVELNAPSVPKLSALKANVPRANALKAVKVAADVVAVLAVAASAVSAVSVPLANSANVLMRKANRLQPKQQAWKPPTRTTASNAKSAPRAPTVVLSAVNAATVLPVLSA